MKAMVIEIPSEIEHYAAELTLFMQTMVDKLDANKSKGHWDDVSLSELRRLLGQEVSEFQDAIDMGDFDAAFEEGCDVANFAMMLGTCALRGATWGSKTAVGQPLKFVKWAATSDVEYCIFWPYKSRTGPNQEYGSLSKGASEYGRRAHRVACATRNGPPPSDRHVAAHTCGNSLCVNGSHLRWATPEENEEDKRRHGTNGPFPMKLNWDAVEEMRASEAEPKTLAEKYGVSRVMVGRILQNKAWVVAKQTREEFDQCKKSEPNPETGRQ